MNRWHRCGTTLLVICMLSLVLGVGRARAHTMGEIQVTCPVCDHAFEATVDMSGTQFDMRLDLRPLGPTPAPWKIPVCPQCQFVLFDEEPKPDVLDQYKAIVASDVYQAVLERPSYRRLAVLMEQLGRGDDLVAHTYLKASWQEELGEDSYREDVELALRHFDAWLATTEARGEAWWTAMIVSGELERRLGRFAAARSRFETLQNLDDPSDPIMSSVVTFQLARIEARDTGSYTVSDVTEATEAEAGAM
jgi:hypothetical protein